MHQKNSIFILLLISCISHTARAQEFESSSLITRCDTLFSSRLLEINQLEDILYTSTFSHQTPVHCSPDKQSTQIGSLAFNQDIFCTKIIQQYKTDTIFSYETSTGKKTVNDIFLNPASAWYEIQFEGAYGYIETKDAAIATYYVKDFIFGKTLRNEEYVLEIRHIQDGEPTVVLDSYQTAFLLDDFFITQVMYNGLSDCEILLHFQTWRQSCPGWIVDEFVAVDNGKMYQLAGSSSSGEAGEYDQEILYLPLKFNNGTVLLTANADYEHIFNPETASLNTLECPKHLLPQIEKVVGKKHLYTEAILDENGEVTYDEFDMVRVKVIEEKPVFFIWENGKLIPAPLK